MATNDQEHERRVRKMELDLKEKQLNLRMRALDKEERSNERERRLTGFARVGCFVGGVALVGAGIADGLINPFAFLEAPALLTSGLGLMIVGATGKKSGSKE